MRSNPFNLTFGKVPPQMIARYSQSGEIMDVFTDDKPSQQVYMITGVRGSGKTVFMSSIVKALEDRDDWIVAELNSSGELLKELAAKLYSTNGLARQFELAGIDLSVLGIGVSIKKAEPITDLQTAAERMIEHLDKNNKRVLIAIDEVSNTQEMRYFAGAYQMMVRHGLPVFLIMTGLYENINKLQNEDNLTFLYRAPKIYLNALNTYRMSEIYEKQLRIGKENATFLAKLTKGYSFAFQVIGYFTYNNKGDYEASVSDIRQYLDEYVYDKIWMELSEKETKILGCLAEGNCMEVKEIKEMLKLKPNEFSVYRDRLIKKGVLDGSKRGRLDFALPFFDEYVREHSVTAF